MSLEPQQCKARRPEKRGNVLGGHSQKGSGQRYKRNYTDKGRRNYLFQRSISKKCSRGAVGTKGEREHRLSASQHGGKVHI